MLRPRLALVAALVVLLAACGGSTPSSGASTAPGSPAAGSDAPVVTDGPASSDDPGTSEEPAVTDEPVATDEPSPTDDPGASESPSVDPGAGAEACSGNDSNREFFAGIAKAVDWPVLCGVLPKGWFVSKGSYRLANGGKLIISYHGPASATITLSEGAYCLADAAGCTPAGTELGDSALGPLGGTLYQTADGFAIVVAAGENPGWSMATKGLEQATTVALAAALAQVGR